MRKMIKQEFELFKPLIHNTLFIPLLVFCVFAVLSMHKEIPGFVFPGAHHIVVLFWILCQPVLNMVYAKFESTLLAHRTEEDNHKVDVPFKDAPEGVLFSVADVLYVLYTEDDIKIKDIAIVAADMLSLILFVLLTCIFFGILKGIIFGAAMYAFLYFMMTYVYDIDE